MTSDRMRDHILPPLLFLGVALLVAVPVLRSAPLVQDSFWIDYVWAGRFHAALAGGTVYPRWLADSFGGLGAPVFDFYAPIAFYAAAGWIALGLAPYPALIATFVGFHALSGVTMHRWLGGRGRAAAGGALLYMLLPYHLLDFHRRGALAEFAACALLPLVARAVVRADGPRGAAKLALCYAALVMTHLPAALLASVLLVPPLALRGADRRRIVAVAGGLTLGIALAGVYLLPALLLQRHSNMGHLWGVPGYTPAAWSLAAPGLWVSRSAGGLFAGLEVALALAAAGLWRRGRAFWPAVALAACLIAANLVPGFWSLPVLARVQFPWRALTVAEFAIATAFAGWLRDGARTRRAPWMLAPAIVLAVPIVLTPFMVGHPALAELDRDRPEVPEYLPAATPARTSADAEALARSMPDAAMRGGHVVRRRFWFPGTVVRCAGGRVAAWADGATGLVAHAPGRACVVGRAMPGAERAGWIVSMLALLCVGGIAAMHPIRRSGVHPPEPPNRKDMHMADTSKIQEHMNVIGADGVHVGTVDHIDGDRIKLTKNDSGDGKHHYIATGLVADVEGDSVRLSANADVAVSIFEESE